MNINIKLLIYLISLLILGARLDCASAQQGVSFTFSATNLNTNFTLSNQDFSVTAETLTDGPSSPKPPFAVHLWVTFGEPTVADLPRASALPGILVPDPNNPPPDPLTTLTSGRFRLPVIGDATPTNLLEPNLTAANIVGGNIVATVCLDDTPTFGTTTPNPTIGICSSRRYTILPDRPEFLTSPILEDPNQATILWERLPTDPADGDESVGNTHRITLTNQNNSDDHVTDIIIDGTDTTIFNNRERNRLVLNEESIGDINIETGVAYEATVQACAGLVCGEGLKISNVTRFAVNSNSFTASQGTEADVIIVNWVTHASTSSYRLRRCEVETQSCINLDTENNATNLRDENIIVGTRYEYTVLACPDNNCSNAIPTGRTNIGFATAIQPDDYENDDNPRRLSRDIVGQIISANIDHDDRNFHRGDDVDWIKIILLNGLRQLTAFTSGSSTLDTELALFDDSGNIVACALNPPPGGISGHATLQLPRLAPGEYFLRVKQQNAGQEIGPAKYNLEISISNINTGAQYTSLCIDDKFPQIIIVPILDLLLE